MARWLVLGLIVVHVVSLIVGVVTLHGLFEEVPVAVLDAPQEGTWAEVLEDGWAVKFVRGLTMREMALDMPQLMAHIAAQDVAIQTLTEKLHRLHQLYLDLLMETQDGLTRPESTHGH